MRTAYTSVGESREKYTWGTLRVYAGIILK
jgi:hypothetical protein